jgi:excisionase family DNA binding protein
MLLARLNPDFEFVADRFVAHGLVALDHPSVDEFVAASRLAVEVHDDARLGAVREVNKSWTHNPRIGGAGLALNPGERLGRGRRELARELHRAHADDRGYGRGVRRLDHGADLEHVVFDRDEVADADGGWNLGDPEILAGEPVDADRNPNRCHLGSVFRFRRREQCLLRDVSVSDRLLDAQEVAERLGVPTTWVRESVRSGAIPHVRLGRYVRFDLADVAAWLESCKQPGRTIALRTTRR